MSTAGPEIRLPIARLALAEVGACCAVGLIAAVGAAPFVSGAAWACAAALGAMVLGVVIGLAPLALLSARPSGMWAMPVLFAGMVRMLTGLGAAIWAWFALDPHRLAFWGTVLACGIAALVAEVAAVTPALRQTAVGGRDARGAEPRPA